MKNYTIANNTAKEDMKVKVYEDDGGQLHAVISESGTVVNIISGFEDGTISSSDFIEAAQNGFFYADEYDPHNYNGANIEDVAAELDESSDLISEITPNFVELYTDKMGAAGRILFDLIDN